MEYTRSCRRSNPPGIPFSLAFCFPAMSALWYFVMSALADLCRGLFRRRPPRRVQIYCVGTGKSGTHSIASMFADTARAQHEADSKRLLQHIFQHEDGSLSDADWRSFVLQRDQELWLEVDSNQLNYYPMEVLLQTYPQAKFILTIRDCHAWLDSIINHQLSEDEQNSHWGRLRALRFGASHYTHAPEEQPLKDRGLYTIDGYLSSWATHNRRVLDMVPTDRLLVVKTEEITQRAEEIAAFVGLPLSPTAQTHAFKARAKHNILSEINPAFLEQKFQQHCTDVMERVFGSLDPNAC